MTVTVVEGAPEPAAPAAPPAAPSVAAYPGSSSTVRYPRCWFQVGGNNIPCEAATVTQHSTGENDSFTCDISIAESAKFGMGLAEWADYQPQGDVSVLFSVAPGGGDQQALMVGYVTIPEINWPENKVVVAGQGKGLPLTLKTYSKKYVNHTSADIVSEIASAVGLAASVSATSGFAGKIYGQDTTHLVLNRTFHQVLSDLADREGARWYVNGNTLYFEPKDNQGDTYNVLWVPPGNSGKPYPIGTCMDLRTFRNMIAASPTDVSISSWKSDNKALYQGTASAGGVGDSITINHHHSGRTQDELDAIAPSRLKDAIRHDCNVTATVPGDLSINARMRLNLTGTGTIYDQTYDIDTVSWNMGWESSFETTIVAKSAAAGRTP